jgi:transcriptional regulator with XRE-family HTH domain
MTIYVASNVALLRRRRKLSQQVLAADLGVSRSAVSAWENGTAEPSLEVLALLAGRWNISLDRLVRHDLSALREHELAAIERGADTDVQGNRIRVLATTVNSHNEENVEVVPVQARAGYATGYADPEFISSLPRMALPFLSGQRTYRAFPITGDSMPPVPHGGWVVAEYLRDWSAIKPGQPCLVVTQQDGIVFKLVHNHLSTEGTLELVSTNPQYAPYRVPASEVLEVWTFVYFLSGELPPADLHRLTLIQQLDQMQAQLLELRERI